MFRKNVAGQFVYFALVNATTGAALTGATVTGKRGIDGAAQASVTGTITEDAGGQYHLALSQADTNGNDIGFLFTATNAIPVSITIVTTAADPTDAVRFGLTALPNAAAEAAGGLYTRGTGAGQINQPANGNIDANVKTWLSGAIPAVNVTGVPLVDLKYTLGTISPATAGSVRADAVTGAVGSVTGAVGSVTAGVTLAAAAVQAIWDAATSALSTAGSIGKWILDKLDVVVSTRTKPADTQAAVTLVATTTALTTNNDKTGYSLAAGQVFVKKNTAITITFPMTDATTHLPATGLTVAGSRSIDGAAVASCANSVTELSAGLYKITLAAADVNGAMISLIFSATGADTRFIGVVTQP